MSILGELIVKLSANTASFVEGMNAAGKNAHKFGDDIESSLGSLGGLIGQALSPLGEFGAIMGETLSRMGEFSGKAISEFGKVGGAMGIVSAGGAGVAAAITAVGLGSIALATHAAHAASDMNNLAQSTGVSVEALSGLAYVAKQNGVDLPQMATALEKMNKAVFAAAVAPEGTKNAFTRLGISVKDSSGHIRSAQDIFLDLSAKFAAMPDGVTKTAFAMELFGKAGAALVPVLNEGREGVAAWLERAQALGIILDSDTAAAANRFIDTLDDLKFAGQGFELELLRGLMPALQTVADMLANGLMDKDSGFHNLIDGAVMLTKVFLTFGQTLFTVLEQIGIFVAASLSNFIELGTGIANGLGRAAHFDWSGMVDSFKNAHQRMSAESEYYVNKSSKLWETQGMFVGRLWSDAMKGKKEGEPGFFGPARAKDWKEPPKTPGKIDLEPQEKNAAKHEAQVRAIASALHTQAIAELNLAAAQGESYATMKSVEAAGKAEETISKMVAIADRAKGAEKQKLLNIIRQLTPEIQKNALIEVFAKDAISTSGDLRKKNEELERQTAAYQRMSAAYKEGAAAISAADIDNQIAAQTDKVMKLGSEFAQLSQQTGITREEFLKAQAAFEAAAAGLDRLRTNAESVRGAKYSEELAKQGAAVSGLRPLLENLDDAYFQNAEAVRQAQVAIQLYNWELAHPGASPAQISEAGKQFDLQSRQARDSALAQEAARYSLSAQYDHEIGQLERMREVIQGTGGTTLLIDAAIRDSAVKLQKQWDDAAISVGTFGEKTKAVLSEIYLIGQDTARKIAGAILSAYDGLTTNLAKLFTGQKTNFKGVLQGLAEQMTKAQIEKGIGSILGHIPGVGSIFKAAQKADGSAGNPFHVVIDSGLGYSLPSGAQIPLFGGAFGGGNREGGLAGAFGNLDETGGSTFFEQVGNFFKGFGGFRANGGDMSPGNWYVAGERGPEAIFPRSNMSAVPFGKLGGNVTVHNHYNIRESRDLFNRTSAQQMGAMTHRSASMAFARS